MKKHLIFLFMVFLAEAALAESLFDYRGVFKTNRDNSAKITNYILLEAGFVISFELENLNGEPCHEAFVSRLALSSSPNVVFASETGLKTIELKETGIYELTIAPKPEAKGEIKFILHVNARPVNKPNKQTNNQNEVSQNEQNEALRIEDELDKLIYGGISKEQEGLKGSEAQTNKAGTAQTSAAEQSGNSVWQSAAGQEDTAFMQSTAGQETAALKQAAAFTQNTAEQEDTAFMQSAAERSGNSARQSAAGQEDIAFMQNTAERETAALKQGAAFTQSTAEQETAALNQGAAFTQNTAAKKDASRQKDFKAILSPASSASYLIQPPPPITALAAQNAAETDAVIAPKATAEAAADIAPETAAEAAADIAPETAAETAADIVPETAAEAALGAKADLSNAVVGALADGARAEAPKQSLDAVIDISDEELANAPAVEEPQQALSIEVIPLKSLDKGVSFAYKSGVGLYTEKKDNLMSWPQSLCWGTSGGLWVLDSQLKRAFCISESGQVSVRLGSGSALWGGFGLPLSILEAENSVYAADTLKHCIHVFNKATGEFAFSVSNKEIEALSLPCSMCLRNGEIWAADRGTKRILCFASGLRFLGSFGAFEGVDIKNPAGICSSLNRLFVLERSGVLKRISPMGQLEAKFETGFEGAEGIKADNWQTFWVCAQNPPRVLRINEKGEVLTEILSPASLAKPWRPIAADIRADGLLAVADAENKMIHFFMPAN